MGTKGNPTRSRVRSDGNDVRRRAYLAATGALGAGTVAGCLGDDDDDPVDDVDDADDVDDLDPADDDDTDDADDLDPADGDDADDADEADDEPVEIERHDVTHVHVQGTPLLADGNFFRWGATTLEFIQGERDRYITMGRSTGNQEMTGEVVSDWDYQPGLLEVEFHDDFFWWSGSVVNVEDWITEKELYDWWAGGDDFDAHPEVVTREVMDDHTMRLSLADTWREEWALQQVIAEVPERMIEYSRHWNRPWLEQFEDTGGDMDAVADIREELSDHFIGVEDTEELNEQFLIPFEFRADGSIGEVGEEWIEFELVPEKNGTLRHFVDQINFTKLRLEIYEEAGVHEEEAFMNEEQCWTRSVDMLEEDLPFDINPVFFELDFDEFGFTFNCEVPPTDSPQFRRAWTYMADRTLWDEPNRFAQEYVTPFYSDERVERWVSADIIEDFTDFGKDEVMWDEAETEMEIGGFERNGDGDWIHPDDGEAIDITVGSFSWMGYVGDTGADFFEDLNEFGITADHVADNAPDDPWTVEAMWHGGIIPEFVFQSVFGEDNLSWGAWNPNLPESVEAPEIGDTNADPDDYVEYDTAAMTDRLGVTTAEDPYQEMVDTLTWIANQIQPRPLMSMRSQLYVMNDHRWHVRTPEESPETWLRDADNHLYYTGNLSYVPEEER